MQPLLIRREEFQRLRAAPAIPVLAALLLTSENALCRKPWVFSEWGLLIWTSSTCWKTKEMGMRNAKWFSKFLIYASTNAISSSLATHYPAAATCTLQGSYSHKLMMRTDECTGGVKMGVVTCCALPVQEVWSSDLSSLGASRLISLISLWESTAATVLELLQVTKSCCSLQNFLLQVIKLKGRNVFSGDGSLFAASFQY